MNFAESDAAGAGLQHRRRYLHFICAENHDLIQPGGELLLATHSVARRMAPFARVAGEFFYASLPALEVLRRFVPFEQVSKGGNLIFYDVEQAHLPRRASAMAGGLRGTGRIRTYLDLLSTGERSQEAASHFRREVIDPHLKEFTRA